MFWDMSLARARIGIVLISPGEENAVEIVLPSERVMVGDIPDWTDRSFFRGGEAVSIEEGSKQITAS